ncbi:MAG: calcium/sodium antiporter [Rickettsiaceae bacterium]
MDYVLIAAGLLLLFIGGEALVRGSVTISKRLGISAILIGVVVVGFGTSAPELLVSIKASLACQPDIAMGNVVGSNIANILLILGIAAVITPINCNDKAIHRDALAVFVASFALFGLSYLQVISQIAGGIMLAMMIGYLVYSYKAERGDKLAKSSGILIDTAHEHEVEGFESKMGLGVSIMMSIVGIAMLVFGADLLVQGASNVARSFGIPEAVIGLSLVAVGTSLPELATAISAAIKKNPDVIIGNVLGSNLFNILSILGITSLIKPIPVTGQIATFDIPFSLGIAVISFLIISLFNKFSRTTGLVFLCAYVAYIAWMYLSGGVNTSIAPQC